MIDVENKSETRELIKTLCRKIETKTLNIKAHRLSSIAKALEIIPT